MNLLAPVSTIMTNNPITVGAEDNLKKVEDIFKREKINHLPVVDEGVLVGMVSKTDYLFFKRGFNDDNNDAKIDLFRLKTHKVREIMTTGLATLEPEDKINVALEIFKENLFHAIPIVSDGTLKGILSTLDVIRSVADDRGAINEYQMNK
jgi:acetoin utilization protein AcuB